MDFKEQSKTLTGSFCSKHQINTSGITVYKTFRTGMFVNCRYNREVQRLKVDALVESFKNGYCAIPIIVRDVDDIPGAVYEIMDGGHRHEAVIKYNQVSSEKIPLFFIVNNQISVDDMRKLNNVGASWKPIDFFQSFLKEGKDNFKETQEFMHKFPKLHMESALQILDLKPQSGIIEKMKKGEINIVDIKKSFIIAQMMNDFFNIDKRFTTGKMVQLALIRLLSIPNYDHAKFVKKLETQPYVLDMIKFHNKVNGYSEDFHSAYNYRLSATRNEKLPIKNIFDHEIKYEPFSTINWDMYEENVS